MPLPQLVYHDFVLPSHRSLTHAPRHIYFSPARIRSRISLPCASASAAPAALPLPMATPLIAELSFLCSTSLPSACFSFLDLPEKAPETAPKRFRLSCETSQLSRSIHPTTNTTYTGTCARASTLLLFFTSILWLVGSNLLAALC